MKSKTTALKSKKIVKRKAPNQQLRDRESDIGFAIKSYYRPISDLTLTEQRDALLTCMWIDVCAETIADEVTKFSFITEPEDKKIVEFLKYPSITEPLVAIRKQYLKDMIRYGNGGCVLEYKKTTPIRAYAVAGYLIRVTNEDPQKYLLLKVDENGNVKGEGNFLMKPTKNKQGEMVDSDEPISMTTKQFMHFCFNKDSDVSLARSPLKKIYNYIQTDKSMTEKLAEFTSRGFLLPSFLSMEKTNKADMTEFLEYMENSLEEGGKFYGVNKKADVKQLPHWTAEEVINTIKMCGLCVANNFKVPPFMLNLINDTGSLNAREQKARFLENVVLPILEYEAYIWTMTCARLGFESKSEITSPVLSTKFNMDLAKLAKILVGKEESIFTVDEVRKLLFRMDSKK